MPTATYNDLAFSLLETGSDCIGLDLSSGVNTFNLTRINCPNQSNPNESDDPSEWCHCEQANPNSHDWCCTILSKETRDRIRELFCPIIIPIPEFSVPGGKVRLNHLMKKESGGIVILWKAAHGGSILFTIEFESAGTEILGTYHGEINNGRLHIYLAISLDHCTGQILVTPFTEFSADINIKGINDHAEKKLGLRSKIRDEVAKAALKALQDSADDLTELIISTLNQSAQQAPPSDAFFYQFNITDGQAIVSWANSLHHADIVIESVEPSVPADHEKLVLRLNAWGVSGLGETISRSAINNRFSLPLELDCVSLPDDNPLHVRITMDKMDLLGHASPETLGTVEGNFASPGYGSGTHTASDGELQVNYSINVT
jgi:hypothetical protein